MSISKFEICNDSKFGIRVFIREFIDISQGYDREKFHSFMKYPEDNTKYAVTYYTDSIYTITEALMSEYGINLSYDGFQGTHPDQIPWIFRHPNFEDVHSDYKPGDISCTNADAFLLPWRKIQEIIKTGWRTDGSTE
jgi:hypothetical protein